MPKKKTSGAKTSGARRKSGRKYGQAASRSVANAVRRQKRGSLRSGKGGKAGRVESRAQAIAIGLAEARKQGAKVPARQGR